MKKIILILMGILIAAFGAWKIGFGFLWGDILGTLINFFSFSSDGTCDIFSHKGEAIIKYTINGDELFQTMGDFAFPALALFAWQILLAFYVPLKKTIISLIINVPFLIILQALFIGIALPLSKQSVGWLDFYITVLPNFIILVYFLILKDLAVIRPPIIKKKQQPAL